MMSDSYGASSGPGSQPSASAACASSPAGADPSRVFAQMDEYLNAARLVGARPKHFRVSEPLLRALSPPGEARMATYRKVPIICDDIWSWGWMLLVEESLSRWKEHWFNPADHASAIEARRGETQSGSIADESAAPKADAQPSSEPTP